MKKIIGHMPVSLFTGCLCLVFIFYTTTTNAQLIGNDYCADAMDVAVDPHGRIYVTTKLDVQVFANDGSLIRKFGSFGSESGQFKGPNGISLDKDGNVYVTENGNHRVQVFDNTGNFIQSFGSFGNGDGQLNSPQGIAVDATGNIYVVEDGTKRVQVFDKNGNYLRKFGSSGTGNGQFDRPTGIALDAAGNIYISNYSPGTTPNVQIFTNSGSFIKKFGSMGTGTGQFLGAYDLTVDGSGKIYVTDDGNDRIQIFTNTGGFIHAFGGTPISIGGLTSDKIYRPRGIALDPSGNIYLVSTSRVQVFNNSGSFIKKLGITGIENGETYDAAKIAVDQTGKIYISEAGNQRVQVFDKTGAFLQKFGSAGTGNGEFYFYPGPGAQIIRPDGIIYVIDPGNNRIQLFNNDGTFKKKIGTLGSGNGQFNNPVDITSDATGNIYVLDRGNNRVQVFDGDGNFLRKFGTAGTSDGQLNNPISLALDAGSNIYVVDGNKRVQVFDNAGNFIRKFGSVGNAPGQFASGPGNIAIDISTNRIYITDSYSSTQEVEVFDINGNYIRTIGSLGNQLRQFSTAPVDLVAVSGTLYVLEKTQVSVFAVKEQDIAFAPLPEKTYGDPDFDLAATITSGFPITYTSSNTAVATVTGNTVTIVGAGKTTIKASHPGNDEYIAVSASRELTVNKASQTITFPAFPIKSPGDPAFELPATTSAGLPITYFSNNPSVGAVSGNTVTIGTTGEATIFANHPGNSNYLPTAYVNQHLLVKIRQTITFGKLPSKTYGDPVFSLSATVTSKQPLTYTSANPSVASITGNTVTITGAGTTTITASQAGNSIYAPAKEVSQVLTVYKAAQTITFEPIEEKQYGDPDFTINAVSNTGLPIIYESLDPTIVTVSGNKVTIVGTGTALISAYQAGNENYGDASGLLELTVNKAPQNITFNTLPDKTYGQDPFTLAATTSSGLPITYTSSNPEVATINGNMVTIHGAGSTNITASQSGNDNYLSADNVDQSLTINKAAQTITFEPIAEKQFGDPQFTLPATTSSGLLLIFTSSNPSVATITGNMVTITGAGSTTITANQTGNENYLPADEHSQLLIINKAPQSITFSLPPEKTYGDAPFAVTATTSSGSPITYSSSNPAVANVNDNIVTINSAGSVLLTATQPGDDNHLPITLTQELIIKKANQTIIFDPLSIKTYGDAPFALSATTSTGLPVTYTSSNTDIAIISAHTVTIVGAGTVTITASQPGDDNHSSISNTQILTVKKADQHISFSNITTKMHGQPAFELIASSTSGLPVRFITISDKIIITNGKVTMIKPGSVMIEARQAGNQNYNEAQPIQQVFCINPPRPVISVGRENNGRVLLTSSSPLGNQWYIEETKIEEATKKTFTALTGKNYSLQVTIDNCNSERSETILLPVNSNTGLKVYPVPAKDWILLNVKSYEPADLLYLSIYEMGGRVIEERYVNGGAEIRLSLEKYKAGEYLIKLTPNAKPEVTLRFIKQ